MLTAHVREHWSRLLGVGCLSVVTHLSGMTQMGLFFSGAEAHWLSPAVPPCHACWAAGNKCQNPAEPDCLRKVSLLSVRRSSNLLQDIDFKVCCTGLLPASNIASDKFKQIIDILFTEVFTISCPSPHIFSPAYFHQHTPLFGRCLGLPGSCDISEQAGVCT